MRIVFYCAKPLKCIFNRQNILIVNPFNFFASVLSSIEIREHTHTHLSPPPPPVSSCLSRPRRRVQPSALFALSQQKVRMRRLDRKEPLCIPAAASEKEHFGKKRKKKEIRRGVLMRSRWIMSCTLQRAAGARHSPPCAEPPVP